MLDMVMKNVLQDDCTNQSADDVPVTEEIALSPTLRESPVDSIKNNYNTKVGCALFDHLCLQLTIYLSVTPDVQGTVLWKDVAMSSSSLRL